MPQMMSPAPIWFTILVPIVVALITGLVTYLVQERRLSHALRLQEAKLNADFQLQEEKLSSDHRLQEEKLKTELRTEFMAEEAVKQLLNHPAWKQRSFAAIEKR